MMYKLYATQKGIVKNSTTGIYQSIDVVIKRYKDYTDYLLDNKDLFIAPFHEFIKNHHAVTDVIAKTYGFEVCQRLTAQEIMDAVGQSEDFYNSYTGNFPRSVAPEKQQAEDMLLTNYKFEIDAIQENINKLYERYYEKVKA